MCKYVPVFKRLARLHFYLHFLSSNRRTSPESPLLITQSIQHTSVYIGAAKSCCVWISFEKKCVHSKFSPHRMFGKHRLFQTKLPPHLRSDRSWFEYIRNLNIILDFASTLLSFSASFSHQQLTETHGLIFGPFAVFALQIHENLHGDMTPAENSWHTIVNQSHSSEAVWRHHFLCRLNFSPLRSVPFVYTFCIDTGSGRTHSGTQTHTHTNTQVTPLQCTCKHTGQCTWICMQTHTISMTISIFRRSASEIQIVIIIISRSVLPSRAAASGFTCSRSRMRKHMSWAQQ